jgi:sirohydrochlorin cobaltochelatase
MKTTILLVMHGIPPNDFPDDERNEFFGLSGRLRHARGEELNTLLERQKFLDSKMRNWPRTMQNDPFHAASMELAGHLSDITGNKVLAAFNEFCAPDVQTALKQAISFGAERVVVVSTMMTKGGGHAEVEIGEYVENEKKEHPEVEIIYAWPYESREVAKFISQHIMSFTSRQ